MAHARYADEVTFEGTRPRVSDTITGGVAAGLLAGAAMLVWAMGSAALADLPLTHPLELTGATFVGRDGMDGGAPVLLYGVLLWLVVSAALGLAFAAMVPRDFPFVSGAILGIGYSFLVLAVMTSVVLPRLNPTMRAEMPATGGAWVLAYVVFGVVLGLAPRLRRQFAARARQP
jgi:hypothetical protein